MEGVVEHDDGGAPGGGARDLHRVLVRLGAGVHEDRLLVGPGARRELGEESARVDVRLVDADHEALVEVLVGLALDRLDDGREAVAGVLAADAAGEVEEHPAVGVGHARALGARHDEPRRRDPTRHESAPVREDPLGRVLLCRCHAREYDEATRGMERNPPRNASVRSRAGIREWIPPLGSPPSAGHTPEGARCRGRNCADRCRAAQADLTPPARAPSVRIPRPAGCMHVQLQCGLPHHPADSASATIRPWRRARRSSSSTTTRASAPVRA